MKIGIALASYKPTLAFLLPQLESIQNQEHQDWICVVSFDSPIDELEPIAIGHLKKDSRFSFVQNHKAKGLVGNFQNALDEVMKFPIDAVAFSDQDDIWYPEKLKVMSQELTKCPAKSLVHCDMHILDKDGVKRNQTAWERERRGVANVNLADLLIRNIVAGTGSLIDRKLIEDFPRIPDGFDFHDWFYAVAAASRGGVYAVAKPLYLYRLHANNMTGIENFRGIFHRNTKLKKIGIKSKVIQVQSDTARRARAISNLTPLPSWIRWMILRPDAGFLYLGYGFVKLASDPALTRACWARSFGKILS